MPRRDDWSREDLSGSGKKGDLRSSSRERDRLEQARLEEVFHREFMDRRPDLFKQRD